MDARGGANMAAGACSFPARSGNRKGSVKPFFRDELFEFKGIWMNHYFTDNWDNVQSFQAKPDDIVISSFPRSGSTWTSYITDLLCAYTGVQHANFLLNSPRLVKTHLPVQFMPKSFWEKNCKIVYVARNPKDVVVSYYHLEQTLLLHPEPGDWSSYFQRFLQGKMVYGSWFDHVTNWWKKKETYSNLHFVFYEDLVKDTKREIDRLCSFLDLFRSSEEKDRIAAKVQFDQMKTNPSVNFTTVSAFDSTHDFLRKGKVGNWKNYFTVAQNEEFDKDFEKKMKNTTLEFCTAL
ncbi:hypothetical protein WMY93_018457 [Mugilogobius chulae]|uniref:Sulfotransferase n=1 Tax=Mugilogobius chulae TaxID=88201 RepID=A0AAW0NLP2_9GOBI